MVSGITATDPLTPDILCGAGGGPSACLVSVGALMLMAAAAAMRRAKNFMFKINYNIYSLNSLVVA